MKVLHISNSVSTQSAAYRLHKALTKQNIDSYIYVKDLSVVEEKIIRDQNKMKIELNKILSFLEYKFINKIINEKTDPFSFGIISRLNYDTVKALNPDVINLHWACGQFVSIRDLKFLSKYNLVWTLHDSWGFTGGCHIPLDCFNYQTNCATCKKLKKSFNIPQYLLKQKLSVYNATNMSIVTPSHWLKKCCKNSLVLKDKKIYRIGNPIDINFFNDNIDKNTARNILGLPLGEKIIAFGAVNAINNKNKGYEYLMEAIELLKIKMDYNEICLLIFGENRTSNNEFEFESHYLGYLHDPISLKLTYSAADVFVFPSKSENLPNVIMESMACSTPVVAFDVGGISDMVEHKINGYLAKPFDVNDLCSGIDYILKNKDKGLGINARSKIIENYSYDKIAKQYIELYRKLL